jgi:hypothetical protein
MRHHLAPLLIALTLAASPAFAQAPPAVAAPPPAVPSPPVTSATNCTPTQAAPSQGTINTPTTGQGGEQLTDKLARSDGVLCPPAGVDPDIRVPAPSTGSNMPVIPPQGSSGSDSSMRPK